MNPREIIPPAFIFLILSNILAFDLPFDQCLDGGNYTANSRYSANLNAALSALSTNVDVNGFYNVSVGQNPDTAYASVLCQGDVLLEKCRECAQNASDEILQSCSSRKQAIIWTDLCMLRYSNEMIFGKMDVYPYQCWDDPEKAGHPDKFNEDVRTLLEKLLAQAAHGGNSLRKVAASTATGPEFYNIFALVQCTPDLPQEDCSSCLSSAITAISLCNDAGKTTVSVRTPSCNLRFATFSFFNETRLQELADAATAPNRPPILPTPGSGDDNTAKIVIIIVVTIGVCLVLAACVTFFLRKRMKQRPPEVSQSTHEISTVESLQYDFGTIRAATNDFADANKLGQGGFGVVYKGNLLNGQEIAVKRLSRDSGQGSVEFKNEVLLLARLQHRNLVRLLGFSLEGAERLLIYEFVQNSSLDQFIFDPTKRSYLDWNRRYKIIWGIAKGLLYLHEDSRLRIIHRDLKASNVLLDGQMNPKIADFGMARLFGQDETQGNTNRIVGTYGYMSPEYTSHGQFSPKSDVFSFGVLVLEILSGRKNSYVPNEENVDLLSFAWKHWREGKAENVIDPVLRASTNSMGAILRCIHMGLLCVQENVIDRPTMPSIVLMLNSFSVALPLPKELHGPISYDSRESNSIGASRTKAAMSEGSSSNSMSLSEFYAR